MRNLVLLLGLAVLGIAGPSLAGAPRTSKTRVSQNGRFSIRLTDNGDGSCKLEVRKDSAPSWSLSSCVGGPDDLYFISDDGEKFWVVYTLPQKGRTRPKKAKHPAWTYARVAALFDRAGKVLSEKKLNDFIRTRSGLDDVRLMERHFKWLEGVSGVPGNPPRLAESGQVELTTIEHKQFQLQF